MSVRHWNACRHLWPLALLAMLAGGASWIALSAPLGADYPGPECSTCDYPGPAINALTAGHLHTFFSVQPVMGSFSLLFRAPFAALVHGELWRYRVGALACLLVVAAIAWLFARLLAAPGRSPLVQLAVGGLLVASPLTFQALRWGHPEELLAAALCLASVVLARKKAVFGGIALGLAVATKQWALLAVAPVVMLAEGERIRLGIAALATALVLTLPMVIGDATRFFNLVHTYGSASGLGVTPSNIWWPLGHQNGILISGGAVLSEYALPSWLQSVTHPLLIIVVAVITAVYWRARLPRTAARVFRVLALVFLLRCMLDPFTYGYHHVPMLFMLVAAEGLGRRRLPWVSLAVAAMALLMNDVVAPLRDPNLIHWAYLSWAVPLLGYLIGWTFDLRLVRPTQVEPAHT